MKSIVPVEMIEKKILLIRGEKVILDADLALNKVVKIETSESPNSTVDTLEKIAKALGVPVAELFK